MFKIPILLVLLIVMSFNVLALNIHEEYESAKLSYEEKNYLKAAFSLEKVLNEYPDYSWAKLLEMKTAYELSDKEKFEKRYKELIKSSEEIRLNMFSFFMEKKIEDKLEEVFKNLINKENVEVDFLEYLYKMKRYKKILNRYSDTKFITLIEKEKTKADISYYKAIDELKKNNKIKALGFLEEAIDTYPENYIYYLKIGQVYADSRNYYIAEYNFLKALEFEDKEEIYLNLFELYKEMDNIDGIYSVSKKILHHVKVKKALKKIYEKENRKKRAVSILRSEGKKIMISRSNFNDLEIGDTYFLQREKDILRDSNTGEVLAVIKEKTAKVRVYELIDKIVVLYIIDEYEKLDRGVSYYLY